MSERSPDPPQTPPRADPTRDIRLPPLPDRPSPAVPPEWSSYVSSAPAPAGRPPPAGSAAEPPTAGSAAVAPTADHALPRRSVDEPTDRLASPSDDPLRQGTRAFSPAPPVQLLRVSVTPTRRRTTKVLWILIFLTLAVIIACGVYLVLLVNQR